MDPISEKQFDKNQLLNQQPLQKQLQHQQQQQLLKQQLQQQSNRQQFQQQQSQQLQSQTEQQQQQHRLLHIQPQPQQPQQQQQQLSQIAPQFRQQQQQKQQLHLSTKQQQSLRSNQGLLQQQILQQEHLKQQKQLLDSQKKQEQALLELLQLQDTNDDEDGTQEERLIAQQQRPQLIQQQQQLHLQQQQRQQQEHQQELHLLQQKQLQQSSQLVEKSQLMQQTQQQQSQEIQPQFIQQPHIVKQPQVVHKSQLVQQSQIVHQPQIVQHSQTLNQSQVIQQPQLIQQSQLMQQPKIIQSQQLVTVSSQQQTKKPPPHSQQLLQQQLQQLLSKNKNYPQRIVLLGSQPQQQQLVTQQTQRVLTANTSVQQQILPQQMQCVVVTGAGQPQPQQVQRVVVATSGQQKQQPQQMQRVVVTSTSGQKQQQLTQQQLQQIQHVVIPSANQQQSLQLQNVINPCSVQQQPQQMQRVVVAAPGQTQSQLQQTQRVIVTSTSGQPQQQLVQPVTQRIVIGQLKTSTQGQQIQSQSQRSVVLGHVQQQVIQRPSPAKQQQQRVVIAGQQQILKLPSQQQSMQQLLKLPQTQSASQQILKLPQEMLIQQQQLSQQLLQPKSQQNDIQQFDGVQQQQQKQVTQQQANLKSSDQSLVQQLHVKQSHQQLQQLHIQPSQKQLQQQQKPLKQNQQEKQIEQPHHSGSIVIGQRQQSARSESDDLQQKQLQQMQRKNVQERLLLQQRQQQDKQQKYLQEQQLQQKQKLREQILQHQHHKQQHQLLLKQQSPSEHRVSHMTGVNQEQKKQGDQESNHHQKALRVQKRYLTKTTNTDKVLLGELVSLSSSSDEDDDDDIVRDQRNLLRKAKRIFFEQFNAISRVLEPKYKVFYVGLLKDWINGQLSRDEFDRQFHEMIYVSTTSIKSGDGIFKDTTSVVPTDSSCNSTIDVTSIISHDSLGTSVNKSIDDEETLIPTLNVVAGNSTPKLEEETIPSPSINNPMAHIASTLKKVEENHKETGIDMAITKRVQLHNALVASLTAYMPFQILRQKRREARTRGFTETGFPLRLFTYMDVPQVRESIMHWYPHAAGSLARWCWPTRIPCVTSLLGNNIEKKSLKSFRKTQQKEMVDAVAAAVLLRPPYYESLPSLFEVTSNTEIAQAIQLYNFQTKQPLQFEINAIKNSQRKQFEQMAQKIRLRDWLTNWLRQLKVQGQELECREHLLVENLRKLQAQILNQRSKMLKKFKIRQRELQARVRRYCNRSSQDSAKYQEDEINEDFEDDLEDDQISFSTKHRNKDPGQEKSPGKNQQHRHTKIAKSLPRKTIRSQRRKSMFSMITLLQDRIKFQSDQQMLQEIRQECSQIRKVYDHVREIRKKYCPCCAFDVRPCQYRKLMRKFRKKLQVNESNENEDELENNWENEVIAEEEMEMVGIQIPETLLVEKDKAFVEKTKINVTKVTEPLDKRCEDIQQNENNSSIHAVSISSESEATINGAPTSITSINSMSYKTAESITENLKDSSATTSKCTVVTTVAQTLDIANPVVEIEKHDVGVSCELVRGEALQTQAGVTGSSSIQKRLSSSQDQCSIVNVADYAARAAEAALAASRRSDRRPSKSVPVSVVNKPKESVDSDDDDDNEDKDGNNCNRQASKLMPPPPPLPPTLPSQPKVVTTSRKPTIGARYLQQQQLLLDRHKQLERMRQEEKEKQQRAQFEHLREQREFNGKEKEKSNMMMEIDDFSTGSMPPMQLIRSGRSKKSSATISQNIYPGSNGEDKEIFNCPSHSKDKDAERPQQSNYYFYCGDYCSSDDETSGSSSIPPLLHDLRIDQLPRPSSRVPAAAVLPPGVRKRQFQVPQSVFNYEDDEPSAHNSQSEVECQQTPSVLQQRMHRESKKRRNVNELAQKELPEHGALTTKPSRSSPLHSQSPPLERENAELGTYSCRKSPAKMQSNLRKRLQFELLEKPGQRQQYQQYKNDDELIVDDNSPNETAELHQQQSISQERPANSKIIKSNSISMRQSRYKVPEKCSAGVEKKTYYDRVVDIDFESVIQQKNNAKQVAVSLVSKKKTKRQLKRIGGRRKKRKRKDKTSALKDEDSSSSGEEEDSEEAVDVEELRMVQWKPPLTQWNKRPISYVENINQEQSVEENINIINQQIEVEMDGDVVSEEHTKQSKCNQSPKNKIHNHMWQEVSEIYLQDSEFCEMKRLDLEYRKLVKALLSDNRIKHLIEIQQHISENMNRNSSSDNEELPSLSFLSSAGNEVQKCLAIHQIHYWMSEIQQKREEIFNFMKRVQDNSRHVKDPVVPKNKVVITQRLETVAEVNILQEWHDLYLSKYKDKPDDNSDNFMYNDKRLFLIQDLVDQYYPISDNKTANNKKWLRVSKIRLHDLEFNEMKRLIFEYKELLNKLTSNWEVRHLVQLQHQLVFDNKSSDDKNRPSHLILTSLNESQLKNLENIRNLLSAINEKWEEMYQLLGKINDVSRADVTSDKILVLTQRVETTKEIDSLQLWHDFLVSACGGKNKSNDDSEIIDHFLIQELIERYYPKEYVYDGPQVRVLVNPNRQDHFEKSEAILVEENDNSNDDSDDYEVTEEDSEEEREEIKQILRVQEYRRLDQKREILEYLKKQCGDKLKNNEGELKQLSELRREQYQRHKKKGFHDTIILKSDFANSMRRGLDHTHPIRLQLFYKIVENKKNQMQPNFENQQQSSSTSNSDDSESSNSINNIHSIFLLMNNEKMFRGSAHWWTHFGLERQISPLVMKFSPDFQTRPMVTVPFINQLQVTKPQTRTRVAQVIVNEQPPILPIIPTYYQEKKLWEYIERPFFSSFPVEEAKWLQKLQWKLYIFGVEAEQHWKLALKKKQKQVELLQKNIQHGLEQERLKKSNQEQDKMHNAHLKIPDEDISVLFVEHGTDLHDQWNLLEAERQSHEQQWKTKRFEHFEMKKTNRLFFREVFSRLKNNLALEKSRGLEKSRKDSVLKKIAFEFFSDNFRRPLDEAEREKLGQDMLNPNSIEGGSYYQYHQRVLNITKENESKEEDSQLQVSVDQSIKQFKLEQLLNLIINEKVPNIHELHSMQPDVIKQLLQEQSDQFYRKTQIEKSLVCQIYKYKPIRLELEKKEREQNRLSRDIFQNIVLLLFNQRIILLEQLNRVKELSETRYPHQRQTSPELTSSTQQMSMTSVILVPQPTTPKQPSSKASVILTPHEPSTLKPHSSVSLIPHYFSTSLQSSMVTVQPQPLHSSEGESDQSLPTPPTLEMFEETQQLLEQRLSLVNRRLTPLMKWWGLSLYFPDSYLHDELDDIVENRLRDLGVHVIEGLESVYQQLKEIGNFDGRISSVKMTKITTKRFERLKHIFNYLCWLRRQIYQLVGESTVLMFHERPVMSTCKSSWGTQQAKYSMSINLERGSIKNDLMYSMSMTFQQPLSFLQKFASPLLHLPKELPMFEQKHATHSLLLKLKRPLTEIEDSFTYSASMVLVKPCMSNQITSTDLNSITTPPMLTSKQQSSSSSVIIVPQQPSTSKYNLSSSQKTKVLQPQQLSISSVSQNITSNSIVSNSKIINNHLNKNREKRRLSSGEENENCGKRLKSTSRKNHTTPSLTINRKRRRQISIPHHQTKKPTGTAFRDNEDTDTVIISDSNENEISDSGSESSLESSIHKPATSMTVQMSEKSPLTIKLIRVKPSPTVEVTPSNNFEEKSMKDHSTISTNNLNDNQNYMNKEKTKLEKKNNVEKKMKKDKKVKQKVIEEEDLKETNLHNDNEDDEMETTVEKENIIKKYPVVDHRVRTSTTHTALINQPSQVSIIVNRSTEVGAVVEGGPTKEIVSTKKPIKVALIESGPLMTSVVDGRKIKVMPKHIKPVNMVCTINEPQRKTCVDHTMGVIKGIVDAAEKTIKQIPMALIQKPQKKIGSPIQITEPTEKLKISQPIEEIQIDSDIIDTKNTKEKLGTNDNHQLAIPIHKSPIERYRHSVRTVTLDTKEPAVPIFYNHGFADGSPERMVHSRFVSTIMSMMAAHSVALRPQLVPPPRLQLLMECATKKLYSNEPLTIGGVNINEFNTLSSLLDQVIAQNSTAETSSINDARLHDCCRTSKLMLDSKQIKKQVDPSIFQKYTTSSSSLITRPSRLTIAKTTPVIEELVPTKIKVPICSTSTKTFTTDVNRDDQLTATQSDSNSSMSTPYMTMSNPSSLSLPVVGLLERSNSTVITTSDVTSSTAVTEMSSGYNKIKRSASAVSLISSSTISNTETTPPSLLVNLPKKSNSAVMSITTPVTAIDTTEFITETGSSNSLRSRPGKRSTSVTTISSPSAVGPPKRSKSAVAMTVSSCPTKAVTIQTTPIMTPTETTLADAHESNETSRVPTSDTSSGIHKGESSIVEASSGSNTTELEETIITKEEMRTVTVKRNLCSSVPAYMDVTTDACALVVSACEQYIRNMVKERLSKCGRGAGTLELRRRDTCIAAMVIDDDIRPVPEYCRTIDLGIPTIHPVVTDTRTKDSSLSVLEQQRFRNYIANKPKQLDVLTIETVVETKTTTTTTTSISSTVNKQFPTLNSFSIKTISSPLETVIGTSARTRGIEVSKKMTTPLTPVTGATTTNKSPMVDNQQLENTTILSPSDQPTKVPLTRKRPLIVPSTSKEYIAGPSNIEPSNRVLLNNSQSKAIPSVSKLPIATSTSVKQMQPTQSRAIDTDAMKKSPITSTLEVTTTPPISTTKKEADLMAKKSSSILSVQRGRLVVSPAFHRRQPFGSLVTTCNRAAAEAAAINKNAHFSSIDLTVESDDDDDDIDGWGRYLGDRKLLPPLSRFPLYEPKTKVPVVSETKNDTSCGSSRDKKECVPTKTPDEVLVLQQEQQPPVRKQDKEEKNKVSQQRLKLNAEQQDNQNNQVKKFITQRLYEHQCMTPESLKVYHQKYLNLQYRLTKKPLLDRPEMRHHGLVSWY